MARVLSSWGYLVGMGFVPLLCLFLIYGAELNPVHIIEGCDECGELCGC